MAIQKGDIKFTGKIGDLVGRQVNGQLILSKPGGFTSEGLEAGKDTNYKKVHELNIEWTCSTTLASSIYQLLKAALDDSHFSNRPHNFLTGHFQRTRIYDDAPSGQRRPTIQSLHTLRNVSLNEEAKGIWHIRPTIEPGEKEGTLHFKNLLTDLKWPFEADLLRLMAINMQIDLEELTVAKAHIAYIDVPREDATDPVEWSFPTYPETSLCALAVKFYQTVNKTNYELNNHLFKALHFI